MSKCHKNKKQNKTWLSSKWVSKGLNIKQSQTFFSNFSSYTSKQKKKKNNFSFIWTSTSFGRKRKCGNKKFELTGEHLLPRHYTMQTVLHKPVQRHHVTLYSILRWGYETRQANCWVTECTTWNPPFLPPLLRGNLVLSGPCVRSELEKGQKRWKWQPK